LPVANADVPRLQAPEMKVLDGRDPRHAHEAFAQPFELQPEPGPVAPKTAAARARAAARASAEGDNVSSFPLLGLGC